MIFPMLAFIAVFTSAIFWLFGISPPDGSVWGILFSSDSLGSILPNILNALWNSVDIFGNLFGALTTIVAGGAIAAGLYSILTYSQAPVGIDNLIIVFIGLFNTFFIISFINWIRGKGE